MHRGKAGVQDEDVVGDAVDDRKCQHRQAEPAIVQHGTGKAKPGQKVEQALEERAEVGPVAQCVELVEVEDNVQPGEAGRAQPDQARAARRMCEDCANHYSVTPGGLHFRAVCWEASRRSRNLWRAADLKRVITSDHATPRSPAT
jgi:hypothetical protein